MAENGKKEKEDVPEAFKRLESSDKGLSSSEVEKRLEQYGKNVIEEKKESIFHRIFKYFWGPIPWMIEVAAILSIIVEHYLDFTFIMVLLLFNGLVAFFQEHQAGNAIEALKKNLAIKCRALRDGKWQEIDAAGLVPGDIIRLRLGDIVPADAILVEGDYLSIDQSALTGESLPVNKMTGETAFSGSVVEKGEMVGLVSATGGESYFGKTVKLVESAKTVSHFQKAVLQIGDFLIYISLCLVFILFVTQLARGDSFLVVLKFALILTVASIPVAMPAVLSVTMAVGALFLSKMKAIVTRLQSIEEMAGIDTLLSDKTGTLTQNKLTLAEPALFKETTKQEIIKVGALASRAEDMDTIDLTILNAAKDDMTLKDYTQKRFVPFDPTSKRTEATVQDSQGHSLDVTKGAPQVILSLCQIDKEAEAQVQEQIDTFAKKGHRTLGVAKKEEGKSWEFLGLIPLYDPPREDSKLTIQQAKEHGVTVKMLTGDNLAIAREISGQLGIGTNIYDAKEELPEKASIQDVAEKVEKADGFAQVFPENKYIAVKAMQSKKHLVGMTGDGVNDAPALKQADLGIAVSGATDAARAAASLVLTAPGLSVIIRAIEEARRIFERMNTYSIYRIALTIVIMIFVVVSILSFNFYPISALMIIILALLDDIPIMTIAYDHTLLSKEPVKWDMRRVLYLSSVLGSVCVLETFLMMVIAMFVFHLPLDEIRTIMFLKLALSGHLILFISRTRSFFFCKPFPSLILTGALLGTQVVAALIAGFGVFITQVAWKYVGYVWVYSLFWMFIEDFCKIWVYHHLEHTHKHHQRFIKFLKMKFIHGLRRNNGDKL